MPSSSYFEEWHRRISTTPSPRPTAFTSRPREAVPQTTEPSLTQPLPPPSSPDTVHYSDDDDLVLVSHPRQPLNPPLNPRNTKNLTNPRHSRGLVSGLGGLIPVDEAQPVDLTKHLPPAPVTPTSTRSRRNIPAPVSNPAQLAGTAGHGSRRVEGDRVTNRERGSTPNQTVPVLDTETSTTVGTSKTKPNIHQSTRDEDTSLSWILKTDNSGNIETPNYYRQDTVDANSPNAEYAGSTAGRDRGARVLETGLTLAPGPDDGNDVDIGAASYLPNQHNTQPIMANSNTASSKQTYKEGRKTNEQTADLPPIQVTVLVSIEVAGGSPTPRQPTRLEVSIIQSSPLGLTHITTGTGHQAQPSAADDRHEGAVVPLAYSPASRRGPFGTSLARNDVAAPSLELQGPHRNDEGQTALRARTSTPATPLGASLAHPFDGTAQESPLGNTAHLGGPDQPSYNPPKEDRRGIQNAVRDPSTSLPQTAPARRSSRTHRRSRAFQDGAHYHPISHDHINAQPSQATTNTTCTTSAEQTSPASHPDGRAPVPSPPSTPLPVYGTGEGTGRSRVMSGPVLGRRASCNGDGISTPNLDHLRSGRGPAVPTPNLDHLRSGRGPAVPTPNLDHLRSGRDPAGVDPARPAPQPTGGGRTPPRIHPGFLARWGDDPNWGPQDLLAYNNSR
ncbi:hypothetical protein GGR53DRAFT_84785 [Hypoxylon sp. FL1150]|nr:hypothetical protein GGR53DRAFT_84785 [Hypoxylon sp. FL1150]